MTSDSNDRGHFAGPAASGSLRMHVIKPSNGRFYHMHGNLFVLSIGHTGDSSIKAD